MTAKRCVRCPGSVSRLVSVFCLLSVLCLLSAGLSAAQEPTFGVTYVSPLRVFTIDDVIGDYSGATYAVDPDIVCLGPVCPGEDPFIDKDGDTLYPVDHTFGFDVMDFVGADDKVRDGVYAEGWIGTYRDAAGNVIGVKISNNDTALFKSGSPKGTWCTGLGGVSVKCESEHLTVMEHVLTCDQTVPYIYYRDLDGEPAPDPTWPFAALDLIPNDQIAPLDPNESSVVEDIVVGSQYSVTKKDDGKILYRWGTAVKRPTDMRLYSRIPLPDAWKVPGADYRVLRAEMVVRHRVTNNPNDQLRPEDWENEGATGRKPHVLVDDDGFWYSTIDCYEGDGDFIPAGTVFRDPTCGGAGCDPDAYSADLVDGLSNAWYTTIDRDPFAWWYDDVTGELISGPRWRLLSNKFGQDIPGLEIPLVDCDPPPYEHGTLRYEVGDEAVTVINLLDWNEVPLLDVNGDPILDPGTGEPILSRSPFLQTADWISTDDPNTGATRCALVGAGGECISENGLPLTDDFDLAVYVKGDKKPLVIYDAQIRVEYAVDNPIDLGDAPDGLYDGLVYAYPTRLPGGAAHSVAVDSLGEPMLVLGEMIDVELDGLSTVTALGDDDQGFVDDEDGVVFVTALVPGRDARVQVEVTASSEFVGVPFVHLWLDVDGDRSWSVDEKLLSQAVPLGKSTLRFSVPELAAPYEGPTFVRVRLSTMETLDVGGAAPDGEVEDYEVALRGRGFDDIVGLDVDEVMVAESTGVSFASRVWTQLPTATWVALRVGDFDGDLREDVAVRRDDTDQWWVSLAMTNLMVAELLWML